MKAFLRNQKRRAEEGIRGQTTGIPCDLHENYCGFLQYRRAQSQEDYQRVKRRDTTVNVVLPAVVVRHIRAHRIQIVRRASL